ncbi:hypothetical protein C8Q74DRAFT_1215661 [Fomes fomentarius]|nr:hypothetical protein C8Q74DRAFT_1215661 [Fomes fomentarius]
MLTVPLCALLSPLFSQGRNRTSAFWFSTHPDWATTTTVDKMVTVTLRRSIPTTREPHDARPTPPMDVILPTIRTLPCSGAESIPRASRRASHCHWTFRLPAGQRALLHASPGSCCVGCAAVTEHAPTRTEGRELGSSEGPAHMRLRVLARGMPSVKRPRLGMAGEREGGESDKGVAKRFARWKFERSLRSFSVRNWFWEAPVTPRICRCQLTVSATLRKISLGSVGSAKLSMCTVRARAAVPTSPLVRSFITPSVTNTPERPSPTARTRGGPVRAAQRTESSQVKSSHRLRLSSNKPVPSWPSVLPAFRPQGWHLRLASARSPRRQSPAVDRVAQSPPSLCSAFKKTTTTHAERERARDTRCHRLRARPRCRSPLRAGAIATPVLTLLRSAPGGWERAPTECGGGGSVVLGGWHRCGDVSAARIVYFILDARYENDHDAAGFPDGSMPRVCLKDR